MKQIILLLVLASGCVSLTRVNQGLLVASTAALACDWGQTHRAAANGWGEFHEANPVMGTHPDTGVVNAYFVGTIAMNAIIWAVLPKAFKGIPAAGVIGFQTNTIINNTRNIPGVCGL